MSENESMEALRQKKMQQAYAEAQARAAKEEQLRSALAVLLEPPAYERLMRVKMSSPETFSKTVQMISYMRQNGQLPGRLGEKPLLALLQRMSAARPQTTITIRRKGEESEAAGPQ